MYKMQKMRKISSVYKTAGSAASLVLLMGTLSLAGCGSGNGTAPLSGFAQNTMGGAATPTPSGTPDPSASATPAPSGSPSAGITPTPSASASPSPSSGSATSAYTVEEAGQKFGVSGFSPSDLNTAGQVIGAIYTPSSSTYDVSQNNALTPLKNLVPYSISDDGQVVGQTPTSGGKNDAALLANGMLRDLGSLGGDSVAWAINRSGQVAGVSVVASGNNDAHAFLYENGAMRDLGTLGGKTSRAYDINDAGTVVGHATLGPNGADSELHPMMYQNGQMQEIPAVGGGSRPGEAKAINNRGQIVGTCKTSDGKQRAFVYENGTTRDVGTPVDGRAQATDINDAGVVVGYFFLDVGGDLSDSTHGFVYQNGIVTDLNSYNPDQSGRGTTRAIAINENGQILLEYSGATTRGYLILTPSTRKR